MKISNFKLKVLLTIIFGSLFIWYSFANIGWKSVNECVNVNSCGLDPQYHPEIQCRKPPATMTENARDALDEFVNNPENETFYSLYDYEVDISVQGVVDLQERIVGYWELTQDDNCKLNCVDGSFDSNTESKIVFDCLPCSQVGYIDPEEGICPEWYSLDNDYSDDDRFEVSEFDSGPWYSRECCKKWEWSVNSASNICKTYWINGQKKKCCGVLLNTDVPFIGKCISFFSNEVTPLNAFPRLMWGLSKMMITAILVFAFMMVIAWWVMISAGWFGNNYSKWKKLIIKVVIWIALLWASWVILRLINPNFFW